MTQQYQCWIATYRNFSQYIIEIPDYPFYYCTIYNTQEMELNYMIIVMTHPSRYLYWQIGCAHHLIFYFWTQQANICQFLYIPCSWRAWYPHSWSAPNTLSPLSHCILKHVGGLETKLQELIFLNIILTDELVKLNNYNLCFSTFF